MSQGQKVLIVYCSFEFYRISDEPLQSSNTCVTSGNGCVFNSSPPGENDSHFADNIFKCIFINEKFCITIQISLKFVPEGPIDNKPPLVLVRAWLWTGDKPLPEPVLTVRRCIYTALGGDELNQANMIFWCFIANCSQLVLFNSLALKRCGCNLKHRFSNWYQG